LKSTPKKNTPARKAPQARAKPASAGRKAAAAKPAARPAAKHAAKPAALPARKAAHGVKPPPTAKAAPRTAPQPVPAAKPARAASTAKAPAALAARPDASKQVPSRQFASKAPPTAATRTGGGIPIAPGALAGPPAGAPGAPSAAETEKAGKGGKKPKPPAKTMQVPAPMTDFLVKQAIPDVRRIASAALLSDTARGMTPHGSPTRPKEPEKHGDPPVDANLIASSLATDVHPKIEDNYDYTVLDEFAASQWCPGPTRMINTGCGGGEAAVYFAKRGFNVVGIDSDRMAVGLARERAWLAGAEIDFMVGEQFETPNLLPAESFGLAVDRGAFYRLADDRDRQRYLSNIRRLLFQGGICFLSAGFFPLPEGHERPKSKKASPKVLLVREGGVVVSEVRQAGFEVLHRVLRPTSDSGEYGELLLTLRK
jgi:SAM-dependent methyltransferase